MNLGRIIETHKEPLVSKFKKSGTKVKQSIVVVASHADVLRGSSRVPAPRTPKNVCVGGYCYSGALAREARAVEHHE